MSSGQELVTTAADYLDYALDQPQTRVVALLLETMRSPALLQAGLARAAAADVPVVALTVGSSGPGAAMVAAHSGALAGADGAWEALFDAYGVCRVRDLDEMADTLELFAAGRRARATAQGIATVHDSGAERALVVDLADEIGAPFATLAASTLERLGGLLDPGLDPTNPLDVWGTGADTRRLFADTMLAMADDPAVGAVALAIDLVHEFDGDESYPLAAQEVWESTDLPVAVLSTMHSAMDQAQAQKLRALGIPVLEGARSGLVALRHLTTYAGRRPGAQSPVPVDAARQEQWRQRLAAGSAGLSGAEGFQLLTDYGIPAVPVAAASSRNDAVAAAARIGWPVVLKTDEPGIAHKSDVGGVRLGLGDAAQSSWRWAWCAIRCSGRWSWSRRVGCWSSSSTTTRSPCRRSPLRPRPGRYAGSGLIGCWTDIATASRWTALPWCGPCRACPTWRSSSATGSTRWTSTR